MCYTTQMNHTTYWKLKHLQLLSETAYQVIVKNSSLHRQSADCWLSVGRLLVICQPTVGDLLADSWPTVDQHLTDSWPTDLFRFFWKDNFLQDICWPTVDWLAGDMSVRCWKSVSRMSVTSCWLLSRKVYDL